MNPIQQYIKESEEKFDEKFPYKELRCDNIECGGVYHKLDIKSFLRQSHLELLGVVEIDIYIKIENIIETSTAPIRDIRRLFYHLHK